MFKNCIFHTDSSLFRPVKLFEWGKNKFKLVPGAHLNTDITLAIIYYFPDWFIFIQIEFVFSIFVSHTKQQRQWCDVIKWWIYHFLFSFHRSKKIDLKLLNMAFLWCCECCFCAFIFEFSSRWISIEHFFLRITKSDNRKRNGKKGELFAISNYIWSNKSHIPNA